MNRLERSWQLFKTSLFIMKRNQRLVAFPVVVFFFTILILLFFLAPVVLRPTGYGYTTAQHWQAIGHSLFTQSDNPRGRTMPVGLNPVALGYLALMYFVSMFFATFFNVAFYHEILAALNGQPVSILRGMRFAVTRWQAVLMWTVFAGLVGVLIKQIERRMGLVGQIIARIIGVAWSIAAVFVIPIIVQDPSIANPVKMLKNSASILKRTWGEALVGFVGIGLISSLVMLGSMFLLIGVFAISSTLNNYWFAGVAGVIWLLAMFAFSYLTSVAGQIYKGALYLYAANGIVPEPYTQELLDSAWKFKKQ
jgi:hypothetical protein